ncbi:MAG: WD40 repeat domain-containing serine/threonine protein kinase [Opitutaceae bacterium]
MKPEEVIFADALALPPPVRDAFLGHACGADAPLRRRVESLLSGYDQEGALLDRLPVPEVNLANEPDRAANDGETGTRIGRYKLLQRLGEGGHGTVFVAEQEKPVRRRVALKVVKLGMDTREVIARFEAERQALALMDHPHIARVFDAGSTENGRPFFVMELVRGAPITRHCDEHQLDAAERLRLFTQVCSAVQHAHQKGIIHRDLKPSNILVTLHDGVPVPKIIDFGIAKAMHGRLTERTLYTRFEQFVGTPAYMSPEQLEMSGLDMDTRSDIYSLGVVLYELLTGNPPFAHQELMQSGIEEMRRTIREKEPLRPSTRVSTLEASAGKTVALQRSTDLPKLHSWLRGDIDWIVMRCLEKDRTRRYETANALAADLLHYLRDEPVAARPPSTAYVLRKFVRRHKVGFFATTATAAALVAGLIASSVLLQREPRTRARAVIAEQTAIELGQRADQARAEELKRAARTSLLLADRNFADGRVSDGLAWLVYAARKDPLNPILAPRIASLLASHNFILAEGEPFECRSRVVAIRYSLDGRTYMAGTEDGTTRVFDSATGKIVREVRLEKSICWITGAMFARANDGVFGTRFPDNEVRVFDAVSGQQLGASIQLDSSVTPVADTIGLSPDGRWIYAYAPGTGRFWLWNARTGEERIAASLGRRSNFDFDFSPDGRLLSVAGGNEVRLWSLPDCAPAIGPIQVDRAPERRDAWLFARFTPDGRSLAIIDPHAGIQLCDPATGALRGPRIGAEGGTFVRAWEISSDGRLLGVGEKTSEIRDLTSGRVIELPFSSRDAFSFNKSFSRDGSRLLVTPTKGAFASLWDTKTGAPIAEFTLPLPAGIRSALSPDGEQMVVSTTEGTIHRLRVGPGAARPLVLSRSQPRLPLTFQPGTPTRLLWLASDRARVVDVASGRTVNGGFSFPRKITEAAPDDWNKSALRSDGRFLVVRNGPGWEAWELSPRGVINVVPFRDDPPPSGIVTFNPATDLVAINDQSKIRVWNLRTGASVGPPINPGWPLSLQSVNLSPDGRRLAAAYVMGAPVIWDTATSRPATGTYEANPERSFSNVQFSPDGTKIVTADYRGEARLWDTATGAPLSPILRAGDILYRAAFSPDGRNFATRSSAELRIWNALTRLPQLEAIFGYFRGVGRCKCLL